MADEIIIQPQPRAWLESSVLQPYVSAYSEHLQTGRYAPNTRRVYLCCVAHFASWLTAEHYSLSAINELAIARFVSEHLPECHCPNPARRVAYEIRAALSHLTQVLRANAVISNDPSPEDHVRRELVQFDTHMQDVWGLALNTRRQRCRIVGRFLGEQFGSAPITLSMIKASAVRQFVLGEKQRWSAGSISVMGGAIGGYLRFRGLSGDRVEDLRAAIPRAAHWRLASLPEVLSEAEIEELLQSFDSPFPSHRRAFAMVRCLTDLGLRCSEVVKLRLEDINWQEGVPRSNPRNF